MSATTPPAYNEHLFDEQRKEEKRGYEDVSQVKVNSHQPPCCGGDQCGHQENGKLQDKIDNLPAQPM
uniref:Uncharacterized protein n=1 Tax=Panagrolaimus sp. PS1159 TaxID=55785 RepID=A0AC35GB45_9BILA